MNNKNMTVAIVGGGFSGVCSAIHLLQKSSVPLEIHIIEKSNEFCKGTAYGTENPYHPLNVRASDMGALSDDPEHFFKWLQTNEDRWRKFDPAFENIQIKPEKFYPRKLYSLYLKDIFNSFRDEGLAKSIQCSTVYGEAVDAELNGEGRITLKLKEGKSLEVDKLILATGVYPINHFPFETELLMHDNRYINNIWDTALSQLRTDEEKHVLIIGSGLTAVDALFSLRSKHYKGKVTLLSKHGHLPKVHTKYELPKYPLFLQKNHSITISKLFKSFKDELKKAKLSNADWRQVLNSLRLSSQELWKTLAIPERKRFLQHLYCLYNKHRHRMSPESEAVVGEFAEKNHLSLLAGSVVDVKPSVAGRLQAKYKEKTTGTLKQIEADYVINCSGPNYKIASHPDKLLQNLMKKKVIEPDKLGLGLKLAAPNGFAVNSEGNIFGIGSILFGELFETTAVPELRQEANAIAEAILH